MSKDKSIYDMELHEELTPNTKEFVSILRVPGGWIYSVYTEGGSVSSVFVRYDNEFSKYWDNVNLDSENSL